MRHSNVKWMAIGLSFIMISGCWDNTELNDSAFVLGVGVDISDSGEFIYSNQYALNNFQTNEGTIQGKGFYTESARGGNIFTSIQELQSKVTRKINRAPRRTIVFGEQIARRGFKNLIDFITRNPEVPLRSDLIIVKGGKAVDLLESTTPFGNQSIREYYKLHQSLGQIADITVMDLIRSINDNTMSGFVIPAFEHYTAHVTSNGNKETRNNYRYAGTAVINKNMKLMGYLNAQESSFALWILGKPHNQTIIMHQADEAETISVEVQHMKSKIQIDFKEGLETHITLSGKLIVKGNDTKIDLLNKTKLKSMEKLLEKKVEESVNQLIKKVQLEYKTDILGIGDKIYRNYPSRWRKLQKEWVTKFPKVDVSVKTDLNIIRYGLTGAPAQYKDNEIKP